METNTESSFLFPCSSGWLEAGAGVRAALTMGDGVERGRGQRGRVRSGRAGHTHRRSYAGQRDISLYLTDTAVLEYSVLY